MAAGLGFKTFTTGEVLSAGDTNGYLMQGVLVFASAAARNAAITSPQEGQFAYLKDTDATTYYTGSAWSTVGGGGSLTLLSTTTLSASTTTVSSISQAYKHLFIEILGIDTSNFNPTINYLTNSTAFVFNATQAASPSAGVNYYNAAGTVGNAQNYGGNYGVNAAALWLYNYTDAVNKKVGSFNQYWINEGGSPIYFNGQFLANHTTAMTSFSMTVSTGSYDAGTIKVYGVN
jgi:hypothetical protein